MPNALDGDVFLDENARLVVRDPSGAELFALLYTAADPNGVLDEPAGSIASGPAGLFLSAGGLLWSPLAGGTSGSVLVWGIGVPWTTIESAITAAGGDAIVLVVGEDPDNPTIPKVMTRQATTGLTDLSGVLFIGIWTGTTLSFQGPVLVDFDATPGLEFQIAAGGVLQSRDIVWRYGARIGSGAGPMSRIAFDLDGGGIAPQPGYTGDVVRIGKGDTSRICIRNNAQIGDPGLLDAMFIVTPFAAAPPYVLEVVATSGAVIGPKSFSTAPANPFAPYGIPVQFDGSVQYDPGAHVGASFPIPTLLDAAARSSFDPTLVGVLTATDVQAAIDELTSLLPPAAWADAITSHSTPVPGTVQVLNYFDQSVTIPPNTLEVGDVIEILVGGEYTTIVVPGFDSASVAVSLGTLGFINGNSGPIPYSGCQFVSKVSATIASTGVLGTLLLYQENDFVLQASGVLQYVPQQTGPHNIDTTVANTIQVRGDWSILTDPGASMVLKTLTASVVKKS